MMDDKFLDYYGKCLFSYSGEGALEIDDNDKLNCSFLAGQLTNGDILLLIHWTENANSATSLFRTAPKSFEGLTDEKLKVFSTNIGINFKSNIDKSGSFSAFKLYDLSVEVAGVSKKYKKAHFGLTNFKFTGTERHSTGNKHYLGLPLKLGESAKITIKPISNYSEIIKKATTLKSIDVTCKAECSISEQKFKKLKDMQNVMNDLCYILSVARGTKINWIYFELFNENGDLIARRHHCRVTKPYCSLAIIDPGAGGREDTKAFIENSYYVYEKKNNDFKLSKGTIDAYLDAKAEADYLEMRGVKLAVATEILKSIFLNTTDNVNEFIFDKNFFEKNLESTFKEKIKKILVDSQIEEPKRSEVYKKINELNRTSFKTILMAMLEKWGVNISQNDVDLFVKCRNSLIHAGQFYYKTAKSQEKDKCIPQKTHLHEYFFLVNFLDKLFLSLMEYKGEYFDWSEPGNPKKARL